MPVEPSPSAPCPEPVVIPSHESPAAAPAAAAGARSRTAPAVVTLDGVRWRCAPEFLDCLRFLLSDAGERIRHTDAKRITVHRYHGTTFYKKHYINTGYPGRPLKYLLKSSPARAEWHKAAQIEARGVPVVRHCAFGERWTWTGLAESILITEGFAGEMLNRSARRDTDDLQFALGRFLRESHDRGVLQRDLQSNILVGIDTPELRRVDVYHARLRGNVSPKQRLDNVALLGMSVPLHDAFFRGYGWDAEQMRLTRERIEAIRRARTYSRSRRCLRRNSEFGARRFGGLKWHLRLASLDADLERILRDPDAALADAARVFKGPGHTATVAQVGRWVVKRANLRSIGSVLKDLFRPSRSLLAYRKAHHLELLGIPSPLPVATAERRWLRFLRHGYLVTEAIEGARNLGEVLARSSRVPVSVRRQLAALVARLHDEGFSHRDLKETNLLVDTSERVFLIDLDGLTWGCRVSERRAAADLARLARAASRYAAVTRGDRVAFLKRYCRTRGLTRVPRLPA